MTGHRNLVFKEVHKEQYIVIFEFTMTAPGVITGRWFDVIVDAYSLPGHFSNCEDAKGAARAYCDRQAQTLEKNINKPYTVKLTCPEVRQLIRFYQSPELAKKLQEILQNSEKIPKIFSLKNWVRRGDYVLPISLSLRR